MHLQLSLVRIDKVLCLRLPLQGDVRVTLAVSRDSASIIFVFYTSYRYYHTSCAVRTVHLDLYGYRWESWQTLE